jgi:hypothetical protein
MANSSSVKSVARRSQEDEGFLCAGAYDASYLREIDQIVGHEQNDAGHGRDGQVGRERGDEQENPGEHHRGENRGQGGLRSGFVIDPGTGE